MDEIAAFRTLGSKDRLVDRVVNEIESQIITGKLDHATKLPPERELADQLGVSRTVVREAHRILVARGLLEVRHGVGTLVRRMTGEQVMEPLNRLVRAQTGSDVSFDQLHQVRTILEVEIAGLAAAQVVEADIKQLTQILQNMVAAVDDAVKLAELDTSFHRTLAEMTHNPLLIVLLDSIREFLREYMAMITPYLNPPQDILPPHFLILDAVKAGDPEQARLAMQAHQHQMRKNHEKYVQRASHQEDL